MKVNQSNGLTTVQFGAQIGIKPESIRVRLCQTGSYFGVTPRKLPNGRLLWPADAAEQLLGEEGAA
ncbi:hypothetical protein [Alcanivorax sp.]|uniref:hypothetical protein n=1 Tax=Alcanivorax sp. TaxID=1872427 RepID=UPI0025C4985A|nr:hypothetical protein [Alcanivorax sp.]